MHVARAHANSSRRPRMSRGMWWPTPRYMWRRRARGRQRAPAHLSQMYSPSAALSAARAGKRKSSAPSGGGSSKKAQSEAPKAGESGSRTRLTQDQKIEILALLTQGVTHDTMVYRINCGMRTDSCIQESRQDLELQAVSAAGRGDSKSNRKGGFPKVRVQSPIFRYFFPHIILCLNIFRGQGGRESFCSNNYFMLVSNTA